MPAVMSGLLKCHISYLCMKLWKVPDGLNGGRWGGGGRVKWERVKQKGDGGEGEELLVSGKGEGGE